VKDRIVELIFGAMTACCSGKTTASAVTMRETFPVFAGVTWTETSGATSASFFEQAAQIIKTTRLREKKNNWRTEGGRFEREVMVW
jgi:hypothetical protein